MTLEELKKLKEDFDSAADQLPDVVRLTGKESKEERIFKTVLRELQLELLTIIERADDLFGDFEAFLNGENTKNILEWEIGTIGDDINDFPNIDLDLTDL